MVKDKIGIRSRGGGSIISVKPVFSADGQHIYVACKNQVSSYSTKTGNCELQFKGLQFSVIGLGCIYIDSVECVAVCTQFGKIVIWKADSGLKIKELTLNIKNITNFKVFALALKTDEERNRAIISYEGTDKGLIRFALINLYSGEVENQKLVLKSDEKIHIDTSSKYFVVAQGRKLYFNKFGSSKLFTHHVTGKEFTCVTCHPETRTVLTGDNSGQVLMWYDISRPKSNQAVFHWHAQRVQTVAFSSAGTFFYSGGSECVLVKWQMEEYLQKKFLPRLPSTLAHISVANDNLFIAVALQDNSIHIVDAHFDLISVIQQFTFGDDFPAGIVYDQRSKALVLNSILGHVQFFSLKDLSVLYNLDVVGQNKVTGETNLDFTSVTNIAIDKTGLWMVTVEYRYDPDLPEFRLKFWFFNDVSQSFTLNTSVEYPHEDKITEVQFQPTYNKYEVSCVTISKDKKFKVWEVVNVNTTASSENYSWRCSSVAYYRNLTPNSLSFSSDGSLLAVGFESIVTTWLHDTCKLKCSLRHPSVCDDIIHVSFGITSQCYLLVSATCNSVSVWNLLTLSMVWTVSIAVSLIISDPFSSYKAVFTKNKRIFVFQPKNCNPSYCKKKLANVGDIVAATFVPLTSSSDRHIKWYQHTSIYFIDSNQGMYSLENTDEKIDENGYMNDDSIHSSLFSRMLPSTKSGSASQTKTVHLFKKGKRLEKINELLDAPAHTMAPLHLTCRAILNSMILEKENNYESKKETDVQNKPAKTKRESKDKSLKLFDDINKTSLAKVKLESTAWTSIFYK